MNKKLIITIVIVIQLCFVWQCVINPVINNEVKDETLEENIAEKNSNINQEGETNYTSFSLIEEFDQVIMEGQMNVEDNPWSINVGLVTLEDGNEYLFLTPNTGVTTPDLSIKEGTLELTFCIYEAVRDRSDGAGILIQVTDDMGNLLKEDQIMVNANKEWQEYSIGIGGFEVEQIKVRIMCNNGGNNDDICDWVMIRDLKVSSEKQ